MGTVLPDDAVRDLPIVGIMGNDALSLVRTLPGLNLTTGDPRTTATDTKLAGVSAANIQIQRDDCSLRRSSTRTWSAKSV